MQQQAEEQLQLEETPLLPDVLQQEMFVFLMTVESVEIRTPQEETPIQLETVQQGEIQEVLLLLELKETQL